MSVITVTNSSEFLNYLTNQPTDVKILILLYKIGCPHCERIYPRFLAYLMGKKSTDIKAIKWEIVDRLDVRDPLASYIFDSWDIERFPSLVVIDGYSYQLQELNQFGQPSIRLNYSDILRGTDEIVSYFESN